MNHLLFILFILAGMAGAVFSRKLTLAGALAGGALGSAIYLGVGWIGIALMGSFFLMAVLSTAWKKKAKETLGLSENNSGRRNAGQVLANGGVGGLLGLAAIFFPEYVPLFSFLSAAAFSSATADTVASELGSIHGKKFYDIISLKRGERGHDGVISMEGTAAGIIGSGFIAAIYAMAEGWNGTFLWIVLAGTAGNLADSFLGAALERKGILRNDAVNFLNTAFATLVAYVLLKI